MKQPYMIMKETPSGSFELIEPPKGTYEPEPTIEIANIHTLPNHCIMQVSYDGGNTWADQEDSRLEVEKGYTVRVRILSITPFVIEKQAKQIKRLKSKVKKLTRKLEIEKADNAELVGYGIELLKENKKLRVNPENMGGGE
jgi:hypothetical protein